MSYSLFRKCVRQNVKLRRCPCKTVYYCSKECQAARWSLHNVDCVKGAKKESKYFGGFEIVEGTLRLLVFLASRSF